MGFFKKKTEELTRLAEEKNSKSYRYWTDYDFCLIEDMQKFCKEHNIKRTDIDALGMLCHIALCSYLDNRKRGKKNGNQEESKESSST